MKTIHYFGGFPPPYGGVTVKNRLLADALTQRGYRIRRLDTRHARRNPLRLILQSLGLLTARGTILIAASREGRRKLVMLLARLRPGALQRVLVVVMGGAMAQEIAGDSAYITALKRCRRLFVETEGMIRQLKALGIDNVSLYPNCRPDFRARAIRPTGQTLRCLFFSQVSREKGADLVLEAAAQTPDIEYHFYGPVEESFASEFQQSTHALPNCTYHGIFPGDDPALYPLLGSYDLLLLPTRHTTEGVPGILAESKLAAVAAVVSDTSHNRELIDHGVNGFLLPRLTAEALVQAVRQLSADSAALDRMKSAALAHSEAFLLETHLPTLEEYL